MPARGGRLTEAGKRDHTVSIRLTREELARWHEARERTPRKELGAWARAVVEEQINGHPGIPGDVARVPEINHAGFLQLAALGNNLNQLTRLANTGELPRDLLPQLERVIAEVGDAALALRGLRPVGGAGEWEPDTDSSRDETVWIDPDGDPA
ncbi:plasmid mobilization relaxosome protein MobC [Streptomyces sp. SP17BM10]|uniref:plasmid mobilization relaxosome protein MobC n=1 Tax=Streptomyces sp. SP17BM10 TaxID=3002530 RepID=UPI002E78FEDE|nr:plasmid mobilization relaxosome protein MobC [Streptomyces sp. SP17BM10]MEE1781511.1 plasmid mobilization relaxosome protein MobC [Streptomyces sp. SP17BM10]